MIKLNRALACGALLLSGSLAAHAAETTSTFAFLTGIKDNGAVISLTGVLVNNTAPATLPLPPPPERCATLFLTMLSNPGAFRLTVVTDTEPDPFTGAPITIFTSCSLDRGPLITHG